jgi:ubiquinone/menaquinone biosynthesis C-methylase UbiE/DNA-binding transcriptional ArsR family regulator
VNEPLHIVGLLKAAGEVTRLRLLALLAQGELSVKDFTEIMGQSQPRISRHLKLLADAGLITRHAEGAWAYYRLADRDAGGALAQWLNEMLDEASPELRRDRERLNFVRAAQQERASAYFAQIAQSWDKERSLHVPEAAVEDAIVACATQKHAQVFLDLGTGTGRMLELLAPHYARGVGIDSSREMLAVARAKLDAAGITHAQVRLGDIGHLDEHARSADLVMLHQVLHYFDDPAPAIAHARATLAPKGELIVVDFAPHDLEFLRTEHAHRRLGLSNDQMANWAQTAGLAVAGTDTFPTVNGEGLTVCVWRLAQA